VLVVDASFVVPLLIDETHSEFARDAFESWRNRPLAAPSLLHWEVANVLWKKSRRQEIDPAQLTEAGQVFDELRIELLDPIESIHHLTRIADDNGLTAYDASYLSLAIASSAELATADRNLTKAALRAGLGVHSPFA
jgi:predicted nucleic acid-binding protein